MYHEDRDAVPGDRGIPGREVQEGVGHPPVRGPSDDHDNQPPGGVGPDHPQQASRQRLAVAEGDPVHKGIDRSDHAEHGVGPRDGHAAGGTERSQQGGIDDPGRRLGFK